MLQKFTSYQRAIPRLTKSADPWPRLEDILRDALEDFNYWASRPKRLFPAADYCDGKADRVAYCLLPNRSRDVDTEMLLIDEWVARYSVAPAQAIWLTADRQRIHVPLTRKQRLATWLDKHRGALAFWKKQNESWLR